MQDVTLKNPHAFRFTGDGDTASDPAYRPIDAVLPSIFDVYRQQGFDRGYEQAIDQLLATLIYSTEEFLNSQFGIDIPPDLRRRLVYRYEEHLERHIQQLAAERSAAA
jgi:hypothetical protein